MGSVGRKSRRPIYLEPEDILRCVYASSSAWSTSRMFRF